MNLITFDFYLAICSLAVIFAHFLIGSRKHVLLQSFRLLLLLRHLGLENSSSNESDESDEEESDKLGPEYGSDGTYGNRLNVLLRGVELFLGVTLSADE